MANSTQASCLLLLFLLFSKCWPPVKTPVNQHSSKTNTCSVRKLQLVSILTHFTRIKYEAYLRAVLALGTGWQCSHKFDMMAHHRHWGERVGAASETYSAAATNILLTLIDLNGSGLRWADLFWLLLEVWNGLCCGGHGSNKSIHEAHIFTFLMKIPHDD